MFLFRGGLDVTRASAEELERAMQKWRVWTEELARQGRYVTGQRLTRNGSVLAGKKKQLTDGPFTEGKEIVGGFIVIKAADLADAIGSARGCPIFDYDGSTEVREIVMV
jgi:hypothetical protein